MICCDTNMKVVDTRYDAKTGTRRRRYRCPVCASRQSTREFPMDEDGWTPEDWRHYALARWAALREHAHGRLRYLMDEALGYQPPD